MFFVIEWVDNTQSVVEVENEDAIIEWIGVEDLTAGVQFYEISEEEIADFLKV